MGRAQPCQQSLEDQSSTKVSFKHPISSDLFYLLFSYIPAFSLLGQKNMLAHGLSIPTNYTLQIKQLKQSPCTSPS